MSRGTLDPAPSLPLSLTGLSPSPAGFPNAILLASAPFSQSSTPNHFRRSVWPLSLSLAATQKITQLCSAALLVFSSCGYLDVSVPHVPPAKLFIHLAVTGLFPAGFPHSDISGSLTVCVSPLLFAAFRVLLRLLVARLPPYALLRLIFVVLFFLEFVLPLEIVLRVPLLSQLLVERSPQLFAASL